MNDSKRSAPDLVRQGLCAGTRPLPPRSTRRWALRWSCRRSRSRPAASTTSARSSGLIWPGPRRREAFLRGTVRLDLPRWTGRSKLRAGAARWRTGSRAVPKGAAGGAVKAAGLVHLYSRAGHVDAAQQPALQHGGKVLFKPHHYSQRGRQACWPILMAPCLPSWRPRAAIRGHCDVHSSGLTEWRPIKLKRRPQRCEKFAAGCSTGV